MHVNNHLPLSAMNPYMVVKAAVCMLLPTDIVLVCSKQGLEYWLGVQLSSAGPRFSTPTGAVRRLWELPLSPCIVFSRLCGPPVNKYTIDNSMVVNTSNWVLQELVPRWSKEAKICCELALVKHRGKGQNYLCARSVESHLRLQNWQNLLLPQYRATIQPVLPY